jgi:hypothetical protein
MYINHTIVKLKKLADEGEALLHAGHEIPTNSNINMSNPVFDWLLRCNSLLSSIYGKDSDTYTEFRRAYTLKMSVEMLFLLVMREKDNSEY